MDNKRLASIILRNVGGKENVSQAIRCATRLRFRLRDESAAKTDALESTPGVRSVVNADGQYQIVIGPDAPPVYREVVALAGLDAPPEFSNADNEIVAIANGELIPPGKIQDKAFAQEILGQTVAIEPTDGVIASPANGVIELIHDTGHAFSVRMADGTGLLIHIGIDTIRMKGQGFRILKKVGDTVGAGEPVVEVDMDAVRKAGYSMQTMLIVSEPSGTERVVYTDYGPVVRGNVIASIK